MPIEPTWTKQQFAPDTVRCELEWTGRVGTASRLASVLMGWKRLRFDVTELPSFGCDGSRYSYTPSQGLFQAVISANGDILVSENSLKTAMEAAASPQEFTRIVGRLLGSSWDAELEPYRSTGEGLVADRIASVI